MNTRQRDKLVEAAQNAMEWWVEGSGQFPFDMLRYDKCWPAGEGDAPLLEATHILRSIKIRGLVGPTVARWESYGWKVVGVPV